MTEPNPADRTLPVSAASPPPAWSGAASLSAGLTQISPRATAVFARHPLRDPLLPRTSDVDLLAFAPITDVQPERIWLAGGLPPVDVIWLPDALLRAPEALATYGVMAQRILTSTLIFDPSGLGDEAARGVAAAAFSPEPWAERLRGLLKLGGETIGEIGVTWDFPALTRFWVQIAASAAVTALGDLLGLLAPNAYTRPMEAADAIAGAGGPDVRGELTALLDLPQALLPLRAALGRIHAHVSRQFPEPAWPEGYRVDTPFEYRYYKDPRELAWRLGAAEEMAEVGHQDQAALYLRFWAYSLARIPMVHARVGEGIRTPFGRPFVPVLPDLRRHCPEILPDLRLCLGGDTWSEAETRRRVEAVNTLRSLVYRAVEARDIPLGPQIPWAPVRPRAPRAPRGPAPRLTPEEEIPR